MAQLVRPGVGQRFSNPGRDAQQRVRCPSRCGKDVARSAVSATRTNRIPMQSDETVST